MRAVSRIDQILSNAQAGDRDAIRQVLADVHPGTHRVAYALAGEEERGAEIVATVYRNALRVLPQWSSWGDPDAWFAHQTVQAARRICQGRPASEDDLLLRALPIERRTPAYAAFVRAIRRLPQQQIEAFILHHGQRSNERLIGVAMDCSTQAAQTHLRAADAAMQPLAGDDWAALTSLLNQACRQLTPSAAESERIVRRHLGAWTGKRLRRHLGKLILILLVAGAALVIWPLRGVIHDTIVPTSQPASAP